MYSMHSILTCKKTFVLIKVNYKNEALNYLLAHNNLDV